MDADVRTKCRGMKSVNRTRRFLPGHHCIPGSGLSDHGPEYMLITQVHSKARCSFMVLVDA